MEKISGIYKITNKITGDFYIGSSKNVKRRWGEHKKPSTWKRFPNSQLYQDMQKFGVDNFAFEVIEEVEESFLKEKEQKFIETLNPIYNNNRAKGLDIERRKKYCKEYEKSDKRKKCHKEYKKSKKYKKYQKEYDNQLCFYNNEILTLTALKTRFRRKGVPHPTLEAKKYLLQ